MFATEKLKKIKTLKDTLFARISEGLEIKVKKDETGKEFNVYAWTPDRNLYAVYEEKKEAIEAHNFNTRFVSSLLKHVVKFYHVFYDPWEREILEDEVQRIFLMNSLKLQFLEKYVFVEK